MSAGLWNREGHWHREIARAFSIVAFPACMYIDVLSSGCPAPKASASASSHICLMFSRWNVWSAYFYVLLSLWPKWHTTKCWRTFCRKSSVFGGSLRDTLAVAFCVGSFAFHLYPDHGKWRSRLKWRRQRASVVKLSPHLIITVIATVFIRSFLSESTDKRIINVLLR